MIRPLTASISSCFILLFCAVTVQAQEMTSARLNYILHCQGCHLVDGGGTATKVPALKHEVGRFLQVKGGREYLIQVPGTSQSALTDNEVSEVLNWILETFSADEIPADFSPYTEEEITRHRQPLANVSAVRAGLVRQILSRHANTDVR